MTFYLRAAVLVASLVVAACTAGQPATSAQPATDQPATTGQPTTTGQPATTADPTGAPATGAPATDAAPTAGAPSVDPGGDLDPSLSDAGVVGRMTVTNDARDGRDGTYLIAGLADDASSCSGSFDGENFTAVAFHDDAPDGEIRHMFVVVPTDSIPEADGITADIPDGRAGADFASESGFGTLYYGDATEEESGSVTIDVTRVGSALFFNFDGVTWDGVSITGQMACLEG